MEEKKLTDEEVVKALENCAKELNGCDKCPVKEDCCDTGNSVLLLYAVDLIHRLQENNANQVRMRCDMQRKYDDLQNLCIEQKAEIERLKIDLENEKNWGKIQTKQAVKDTAKEIYCHIAKAYYDKEMLEIFRTYLKERYGVEVE